MKTLTPVENKIKFKNTNWFREINWDSEIVEEISKDLLSVKAREATLVNSLVQYIEQWSNEDWSNEELKETCLNKSNLLRIFEYFYAKSVYFHSMLHAEKENIDVETYFPRSAWYINKLKSEIFTENANITLEYLKKLEKEIVRNFIN